MNRNLFLGALFLTAAGMLHASEIDLGNRIGKAQAAEMSCAPLVVYNLVQSPYPVKFATPCYVVVTVKLIEHRSINIVDYKLSLNGEELSCVALARNNENFVVNAQTMYANGRDRIRLLFIADGAKFANAENTLDGTLTTNLPGRESAVSLTVANLGNKAFTKADAIAEDGNF